MKVGIEKGEPMIRRIYVDNYKCLVNFEICFDELTLLLGTNGTGKSAILDVLFGLRHLLDNSAKILDSVAFPSATCTRWQNVDVQVVEVEVELDGEVNTYRLEVEHQSDRRKARVIHESLLIQGKPLFTFVNGEAQLYRDDHTEGPKFPADWTESALARVAPRPDNTRLTAFLEFMRGIVVCGLYPRNFTAESPREEAVLERDGANFASWYRHMVLEHQDAVPALLETLSEVIQGFSSIRLERVGTEARALMLVFTTGNGVAKRYELRLDEISDGQRALLAVYSLLYLRESRTSALFLDEPDNYISLPELQPWLMTLKDRIDEGLGQVVVCSHHPELIDYLGSEGKLLSREVSGHTKVRPASAVVAGEALRLSEVISRGWER